jgi:hypothetical protein
MKTETWYYCDRRCGYKTQDKASMEEHERTCKCEWLPVWQVTVTLDIEREPTLHTEKYRFSVCDRKEQDRYLSMDAELEYAFNGTYYFTRKFVRTEAETDAALEECKAKMREFLLHLAGQVDGLELKKGE